MVKERIEDSIMFKKLGKKVVKAQTDRINDTIKYLKSKSIIDKKIDQCWKYYVTEQIGLEKAEHSKKNESKWKQMIEGDIKKLRQKVKFPERKVNGELILKKSVN